MNVPDVVKNMIESRRESHELAVFETDHPANTTYPQASPVVFIKRLNRVGRQAVFFCVPGEDAVLELCQPERADPDASRPVLKNRVDVVVLQTVARRVDRDDSLAQA